MYIDTIITQVGVYIYYITEGFLPTGRGLDKADWLSFSGSFFGSIIGAAITILGVWLTLKNNNENLKEALAENRNLSKTGQKEILDRFNTEWNMRLKPVFTCLNVTGDDVSNVFKSNNACVCLHEKRESLFRLGIINQGNGPARINELCIMDYNDKEIVKLNSIKGKILGPNNAIHYTLDKGYFEDNYHLAFYLENLIEDKYIQLMNIKNNNGVITIEPCMPKLIGD